MAFMCLLALTVPAHQVEALTPPPACSPLNMNLRMGMAANAAVRRDIVVLQDFLRNQGLLNSPSTGYFGPLTFAAVKRFQAQNGVPATGFVGILTRGKFNSINCELRGGSVSISNVSGPTNLTVNQQGTWTVDATGPTAASNLSYSVTWGDDSLCSNANTVG